MIPQKSFPQKSFIPLLALACLLSLSLLACKEEPQQKTAAQETASGIHVWQDAGGKVGGALNPYNVSDQTIETIYPKMYDFRPSKIEMFPSMNEAIAAVVSGRIDFTFALLAPSAEYFVRVNPKLKVVALDSSVHATWQMAVRASDTVLLAQLNQALSALKTNGTMDSLAARYLKSDSIVASPQNAPLAGAPTVTIGVSGNWPPFDYVAPDGTPVGYNVALTSAIAKLAGFNVKFQPIAIDAVTAALASERIDAIFLISKGPPAYTDFLPKSLAFTQPYIDAKPVLLVRK
jgi:ABC-type amino acid transport substrate-binding protein